MSAVELDALIVAAERGPELGGISGRDRAMLYRVLASTGLRRSEAETLTRASFDLDGSDGPTVTVEAAYSKRRRRDTLPLPADTVRALREWLKGTPHGCPLWALPDKALKTILLPDLATAKIEYSIVQRIGEIDVQHVVDFHSFRHGYCSALARSNAPVKVLTDLARHSDPRLTLRTYAKVGISDQRSAVEAAFGAGVKPTAGRQKRAG